MIEFVCERFGEGKTYGEVVDLCQAEWPQLCHEMSRCAVAGIINRYGVTRRDRKANSPHYQHRTPEGIVVSLPRWTERYVA